MAELTVETELPAGFTDDDDETPLVRSSYRDEFQLARDKDIEALFKAWQAGTKPTYEVLANPDDSRAFKAATKQIYVVQPKERNDVKRTIRRACLLYKPNEDTGTLGGVPVYVKDRKLPDGRYRIKFTWSPAPVKTKPAANGDATEAPAGTQDQSGEHSSPVTGSQSPNPDASPSGAPASTPDTPGRRGILRAGR